MAIEICTKCVALHPKQECVTKQPCNNHYISEIILLNEVTGNPETQIHQRSGWMFIRSKPVNSEEQGNHHPKVNGDQHLICVLVVPSERETRRAGEANRRLDAQCSLP